MTIKRIYAGLGIVALVASVLFLVSAYASRDTEAQAGRIVDDSGASVSLEELPANLQEVERLNALFRQQYPEIAAEYPPLKCEPGDQWMECSETYWHRFDPRLQKHYGESGYTESIVQCGEQRDHWRTDGKYPDGEQVITFLDCGEGEVVRATPTPGP
jgi:hypothetical protein